MADLGDVASDADEPIGLLCDAYLPQSDGENAYVANGFLQNYTLKTDTDLGEAIQKYTCDICRPNFEAMIKWDQAHGHWPTSNSADTPGVGDDE